MKIEDQVFQEIQYHGFGKIAVLITYRKIPYSSTMPKIIWSCYIKEEKRNHSRNSVGSLNR